MSSEDCIHTLSEYIFWDVDRENVSMDSHAAFIIRRVLEYGQMKDWVLLQSYYGLDHIVNIAKTFRTLDPKALSFISTLSGIPRESFRCYDTPPLTPRR